MRIAQWEFRPRIVPTLAAAIAFALLLSLGFWQLDRARQKEVLYQAFLERSSAAPVAVLGRGPVADADDMVWRRVTLHGRYDPSITLLLDNQVHAGRAGYFVYSPFLIDGGPRRVLVSRGWVPAGDDRALAPAIESPADDIVLEGLAKPVPLTPVLRETSPERLAPGVRRVQQIDLPTIAGQNGWGLLPYEVRLDGEAPGFVRDWPAPGSGRERHLGYAFQWFAMATVLLAIWVVVNLKRVGASA